MPCLDSHVSTAFFSYPTTVLSHLPQSISYLIAFFIHALTSVQPLHWSPYVQAKPLKGPCRAIFVIASGLEPSHGLHVLRGVTHRDCCSRHF